MLSTIITISPDTSTLEGIRNFVYEAARFGLPPTTLLLDGGHAAPAHDPEHTIMNYGQDLQAVISFCQETKDLDGAVKVLHGADLAVDLVVLGSSPISCGEHLDQLPENILVVVQPTCASCVQ